MNKTMFSTRPYARIVSLKLALPLAALFVGLAGFFVVHSSAAATCTTTFTPGTYSASSVSSATQGGAVLCLSTGTYSAIELINDRPSSMAIIQPLPGASVSLGRITLTGASNLTITGFNGSSSSSGLSTQGQYQGTVSNITFSYNDMSSSGIYIGPNPMANANINIDHNNFVGFTNSGEQDRVLISTFSSSSCPNGVTVSNNVMKGGRADGVDINGQTCGTKILNNEITGILQANCGGIHCDSIQDNGGGKQTRIEGNYVHGNSDGMLFDDGNTGPDIIKNNVFDIPDYRCIEGQYGDSSIFDHNTFNCEVNIGQDHGGDKTTNVTFTNNIFGPSSRAGFTFFPNLAEFGSFQTLDRNLFKSASNPSGTNSIIGTPSFIGGSSPATLTGWALAPGSPGKGAASDGTDMGANISGGSDPDPDPGATYHTADLSNLLSHYGITSGMSASTGDLNGDHAVNIYDLGMLLSDYSA